ncbi:MAG: hypothetical protein OEV21_05095, partial [Thermoplasmata archaeon]|nr:hypothetical protein [Thermoplasmata archaeon]
ALMISIGIIFMLPILAEAYIWWKGEKEEEKMNRASVEMKNDALSDAPLKPDQKMIDSKNEDSGKDTSKLR